MSNVRTPLAELNRQLSHTETMKAKAFETYLKRLAELDERASRINAAKAALQKEVTN